MFGLVISDNPAFVTVEYNLVQGRFQHGILVTTGTTRRARAALEQHRPADRALDRERQRVGGLRRQRGATRGCATTSSRTRTPTCSARRSCSTTRRSSGSFVADTNWYASPDPLSAASPGTARASRSPHWRTLSGQDAASLDSAPPTFDADGRVASANLGAAKGIAAGPDARSRRHAAAGPVAAGHERVPAHLTAPTGAWRSHVRGQAPLVRLQENGAALRGGRPRGNRNLSSG